jgi:hypothetical protein
MGMPYPGHNLGAIGFDLHPPATAVALLAAPKFPIHYFQRYGYTGGQPHERRYQAFSMGLSGGLKAQHESEVFMVADWNNCLALFVLDWERRKLP